MKNWDKILKDFSHKCKGGAPDLKNPTHLQFLRESLIKFGWNENATNEFVGNLREGEKPDPKPKSARSLGDRELPNGAVLWTGPSGGRYFYFPEDEEGGGEEGSGETTGVSEEQQMVMDAQEETSDKRDKGEAGAGGESASQGESRYCSRLNEGKTEQERKEKDEQWEKDNTESISSEETAIDERKPREIKDTPPKPLKHSKLSDEDQEVLEALGVSEKCESYDPKKNYKTKGGKSKHEGLEILECKISDEAKNYLAKREVWAKQELQRMRDMPEPNVLTNKSGFNGDEEAYLAWMRAAYDGGTATRQILEESRLDTSQPHTTVQSTPEVDAKVRKGLEDKLKECEFRKDGKAKKKCTEHYEDEIKSFDHFSKYHDTYVVGVDENGNTFIVSISNKKGSHLKDPQNNTTPAQRLVVLRKGFAPPVPEKVDAVITDGIKTVSDANGASMRAQSEMVIDDEFVEFMENDKRMAPYIEKLDDMGGSDSTHNFSKWVKAQGGKKWEDMSTREKFEAMQSYARSRLVTPEGESRQMTSEEAIEKHGDEKPDNWKGPWPPVSEVTGKNGKVKKVSYYLNDAGEWVIETPGQLKLPYKPFGRIITKTGEIHKSQESDPESSIGQAKQAKRTESGAVVETHKKIVKSLHDEDANTEGGPYYHPDDPTTKDEPNGPNTQGYIETALDAMHFNAYIDLDDDDDDKMIVQMGINGARPSDIKNCLAELSGFKGKLPEDKEEFKKFLKERCRVDAKSQRVVIVDADGKDIELIEDTWRTAGTSQKVASHFGSHMRDCVKKKANARVDIKG